MKVIINIDPLKDSCAECNLNNVCQTYILHNVRFYDDAFRENRERMVAQGRLEEVKKTEPHPFCGGCMIEGVVTIEDGKLVVTMGNKVSVLMKQ